MYREDMWWARFTTIDVQNKEKSKIAFNKFMDNFVNFGLSVIAGLMVVGISYFFLFEALSEDFITIEEGIVLLGLSVFFILVFAGMFWVTKVLAKRQD